MGEKEYIEDQKGIILTSDMPDTSELSSAEQEMLQVLVKLEEAVIKMEKRHEEQDKHN